MQQQYSFNALLAILQQAEYDLPIWQNWLKTSRTTEQLAHVNQAKPEKITFKLKIITNLAKILSVLLPISTAIKLSVQVWQPVQKLIESYLIHQAKKKLQQYQKGGLQIIGVAGSYGKTSVKMSIDHLFSCRSATLTSAASYNTPLGLVKTINQLNSQHRYLVLELGEYQTGDLAEFLNWIKPNIVVLTPVGFAHLDRFGNEKNLKTAFYEIVESPNAPSVLICADQNRTILTDLDQKNSEQCQIFWYGTNPTSDLQIKQVKQQWNNTTAIGKQIDEPAELSLETNLLGQQALLNFLPGLLILKQLGFDLDQTKEYLKYAPPVTRRLETSSFRGVKVVDNSYNTNPGSWQQTKSLLSDLQYQQVAVVTGGFVELTTTETSQAHQQLATDLAACKAIVGIIQSATNQDLIANLEKLEVPIVTGYSQEEVLNKLTAHKKKFDLLWLEGGMRELYQ